VDPLANIGTAAMLATGPAFFQTSLDPAWPENLYETHINSTVIWAERDSRGNGVDLLRPGVVLHPGNKIKHKLNINRSLISWILYKNESTYERGLIGVINENCKIQTFFDFEAETTCGYRTCLIDIDASS
jgi:hypothetical protein